MEEATYDFKKFIVFVRRKAWLFVLGALLGAGLGYLSSTLIHPMYQATSKVMITRAGQPQSADFTTYLSDLQMTQTYVQLLTTETVLDIVSERLGIKLEAEAVDVHAVQDTQIIVLKVENSNAQQAALIANTLIEVLMEQNELIQSGHYNAVEESLRVQKVQIETAMQDLQREIQQASKQSVGDQKRWLEGQLSALEVEKTNLQQEILKLGSANTQEKRLLLNQKNSRLDQIQSLISLYQDNYNELLLMYENPASDRINASSSQLTALTTSQALYQQYYVTVLSELESIHLARLQNIPNIVQIEIASAPEKPIRPLPWLNTILGGVIAFVFMVGIAFLREALDDTLKTPDAVEQLLGIPVIGFVAKMKHRKKDSKQVHVACQPHSAVSESFRSLRTCLEIASVQKPIHTILVTSPQSSEGKTTVAVNLAAIISQTGKRVALVEADLRRPQIQNLLGLSDQSGLSEVLSENAEIQAIGWVQTALPNLTIITAGKLPSNPAELVGSAKMDQILRELQALADVVVIDSPPSFVADTQILASKVDAVLLVIQPELTHAEAARNTVEIFKRSKARIVGVVMNRIPSNRGYYDYNDKDYFAHVSASGAVPGNASTD